MERVDAGIEEAIDTTGLSPESVRFCHEPLGPGHIRLLKILNGDYDAQLVCTLVHQSLEVGEPCSVQQAHRIEFHALSYTWGLESPTREILIDGKPFLIRQNLWNFLRRVRECEDLLWADAICINQNDAKEKSEQVALMGSIFSSASTVIVWLGEAADDSEIVMNLGILAASLSPTRFFFGISRQPEATQQLITYRALLAISRRTYWNRAWVIQEVALARGAIYVVCGKDCVEYSATSR